MDPAERPAPPVVAARTARPFLEHSRNWAIAWLGWFMVLVILSSLSHPGPKIDVVGIDKVEHAIYFAVGGTCLALALALRGKPAHQALLTAPWRKLALVTLLTGAAVGWFDEWHQSFTPGRKGLDVYDWMADVLGSLAAVPLARLVLRWLALRAGRA